MTGQDLRLQMRVGAFVAGAILLFVACVLILSTRTRLFEREYTLHAGFRSVEGLMVGAPVRLAGLTVGQVTAVEFGRDPADKRIIVDLSVDRHYQDRIREDSLASISTVGLVGDKYLEIGVGSPDRQPLKPQAWLASVDPPDFTRLGQHGDQIVTSLNKLATALTEGHGLFHALAYDPRGEKLLADLAQSAANLRQTTGKLARGEGTLGALLNDEELYRDLSRLVRGTERSWVLRSLIRSSIRQGESKKAEDGGQAAKAGKTP